MRIALGVLVPQLQDKGPPVRTRIVICRRLASIRALAPYAEDKRLAVGGYYFADYEGPVIVIRYGKIGNWNTRVAYHEYLHSLTIHYAACRLLWLSEGLAELFSTIKAGKGSSVLLGEALPRYFDVLDENGIIPFEEFFSMTRASSWKDSPERRSAFYAQAWLLMHYVAFGQTSLGEGAFSKLVELAETNPRFTEDAFQQAMGMGYSELTRALKRYKKRGKYSVRKYTFADAPQAPDLEFRDASRGEVNLLYGILNLKTRGNEQAAAFFEEASEASENLSLLAAYEGYLAYQAADFEKSVAKLEKAMELGRDSPYTLLNYATARLELKIGGGALFAPGALDGNETVELLQALFEARSKGGPFSPRLYQAIGRVWLSSELLPSSKHVEVVEEGLNHFPDDALLALLLAECYKESGDTQPLAELLARFPTVRQPEGLKADFQSLVDWLSSKSEGISRGPGNQ